jgi:primosomal protein N' (replication factor Y) (superfamily II helicase)
VLILDVLTQYGARALDRTFSYLYDGPKKVEPRYRVLIDFNGRPIMGFVTGVSETKLSAAELEKQNGYPIKKIIDVIDEEPLLTDQLMDLAKKVSDYYLSPLITVLQAMLPQSLSPKLSSLHGPKIAYETMVDLVSAAEDDLTPKQIEMLRLIAANHPILKKEAGSASILSKLVEAGRVRLFQQERQRYRIPPEEREEPHEMTIEQKAAYETILESDKEVVLLEGVTGSGKTEVYLRLSEQVLAEGKNVLMLVPEINLTPAMVEYFSRRFGNKVAILHSELTPGERYDEYRRIARGEAPIVVGARSAVFAPLSNIGLIILDEEHVDSYKQDNAPYYHAREVAIMRGKSEKAKVVLGSATPSLESKARALRGVYGYAEMRHRIHDQLMPKTTIIDLTDRKNFSRVSEKISLPLLTKIKEKLDKKEQIILLINRRGYWTNIVCPHCGHLFVCPSCGGNLTYHQSDNMLKCHHCGYVEPFPAKCPECGTTTLMRTGYGTERVVKELTDLFPGVRVARLDGDIGKIGKNVEKTLRDFHDGEYDILVGTQMIAKGHDFPNVTLSGVVLADIGLSLPTYRASERTFELIAQAAGRSGRAAKAGEAIIQSYNPGHYAIVYGAKQDYEAFFAREMQERKAQQYPPYVYLFLLVFASAVEEKAVQASGDFKRELLSQGYEDLTVVGPLPPYYLMDQGKYRRMLLIKCKKPDQLRPYLRELVGRYSGKAGVDIAIDVDPLDY